jgi:hypothetical protein
METPTKIEDVPGFLNAFVWHSEDMLPPERRARRLAAERMDFQHLAPDDQSIRNLVRSAVRAAVDHLREKNFHSPPSQHHFTMAIARLRFEIGLDETAPSYYEHDRWR